MKPGRFHWGRNSPGAGEFTRGEFCQAVVHRGQLTSGRGNLIGQNSSGGNLPEGNLIGGNWTEGNFPCTILLAVIILINTIFIYSIFSSYSTNSKSIIVSTMIKSTSYYWTSRSQMFLEISVLKNFAMSKTSVLKSRFKACNFIKKRLQHRCFPINIEEQLFYSTHPVKDSISKNLG